MQDFILVVKALVESKDVSVGFIATLALLVAALALYVALAAIKNSKR